VRPSGPPGVCRPTKGLQGAARPNLVCGTSGSKRRCPRYVGVRHLSRQSQAADLLRWIRPKLPGNALNSSGKSVRCSPLASGMGADRVATSA
jgi:hypothetical protein